MVTRIYRFCDGTVPLLLRDGTIRYVDQDFFFKNPKNVPSHVKIDSVAGRLTMFVSLISDGNARDCITATIPSNREFKVQSNQRGKAEYEALVLKFNRDFIRSFTKTEIDTYNEKRTV